jgi:ectoine hydroxylase-related dioxygenase (phytanoyl-CoA dioxygenase family)
MLTQQQIDRFHARGFLNAGPVLDPDQVQVLRDEVLRTVDQCDDPVVQQPVACRDVGRVEGEPLWQIVDIWVSSQPFRELLFHPRITRGLAQLTAATELRIWHDQIQYKPAQIGGPQMWHQDAPLWPIIAPMTEVTAWVALDDADETNGCMSMVPGSHRWGNRIDYLRALNSVDAMPASFQGHPISVERCPVKAGEVHYHHALTWHASHANTSGRPRRAIALHYMTQETRYVAGGEHLMKPYVTVADNELLTGAYFPKVYPPAADG